MKLPRLVELPKLEIWVRPGSITDVLAYPSEEFPNTNPRVVVERCGRTQHHVIECTDAEEAQNLAARIEAARR